jgi:hypothetical protein
MYDSAARALGKATGAAQSRRRIVQSKGILLRKDKKRETSGIIHSNERRASVRGTKWNTRDTFNAVEFSVARRNEGARKLHHAYSRLHKNDFESLVILVVSLILFLITLFDQIVLA